MKIKELTQDDTIDFYKTDGEYGFFSNFSKHPITVNGKVYPTSEHYYQSMKYAGVNDEYAERIRKADTPMNAAILGRDKTVKMQPNWKNNGRDIEYMQIALRYKFDQHPDIRQKLVDTGNAQIYEHTINDNYWGDGGTHGMGRNHLGVLLMNLRKYYQLSDVITKSSTKE